MTPQCRYVEVRNAATQRCDVATSPGLSQREFQIRGGEKKKNKEEEGNEV